MKFANADAIRRRALDLGAEATINGRSFNAGGHSAAPRERLPAMQQAPAAAPQTITAADVERIVSERVSQAIADLSRTMVIAIAQAVAKTAPIPGKTLVRVDSEMAYDEYDRLTKLVSLPHYEKD